MKTFFFFTCRTRHRTKSIGEKKVTKQQSFQFENYTETQSDLIFFLNNIFSPIFFFYFFGRFVAAATAAVRVLVGQFS